MHDILLDIVMTCDSAARLLETARLDAGLSQRQLAARAHTTQAVVARIEAGRASPRWNTLQSLLRAAGFRLRAELRPEVGGDSHMLSDVARILRLSPEDRIREVAAVDRFTTGARRVIRSSAIRS